jgi:predicted membrane chloride channel (bestrophin family)
MRFCALVLQCICDVTLVSQGKHIIVLWYSIIMHLRRQPVLPKNSRLWLYLYPKEFVAWEEADVRPLYLILQIGHHIARLRDKGILSDGESIMMAQEVKTLTRIFGTMEAVRDTPTIPFVYYQFCNWMALLYCLTGRLCYAAHALQSAGGVGVPITQIRRLHAPRTQAKRCHGRQTCL